jgi:transposase
VADTTYSGEELLIMEVVHRRCVGIDIAKRGATVCVRVAGKGRRRTTETVTTWGSMTNQILALREHLVAEQVSCVAMEATGDYWKPFYYLLEDAGFELLLANARHVKNMPGRKTDVSDAVWLAQLAAHGLVRGSLVPPPPIRQLRDLTRTRTAWVRDRSREIARLERLLEDAGIKLSSVASELNGVSGRAMLSALINGERDPVVLANLAKRRLRHKIPVLVEALTGRFTDHHAYLARMHLEAIERHDARIADIEGRIEVLMEPFQAFRELICSIPGISHTVADIVIAETGGDLTRFASPQHLTSWAGVCPGSNESAGRVKSTKTRAGDPHLKGALGIAALAVARNPNGSYLGAKYRRIASRRGPSKAIVSIERAMLVIIWQMSNTGAFYQDLGLDYYTRRDPERVKRRALKQLASLGYKFTIEAA